MIDIKQELERIGSAYMESFNRQDAAGIAALYANGGMHINPAGPRTDIEKFYQAIFKAGFDHHESNLDEAWRLGNDTALAIGQYRILGTDQSGAVLSVGGIGLELMFAKTGYGKFRCKRLSRNRCAISTRSPPTKPPSSPCSE